MAKEHQPNVDSVVKWRAKYNQFNFRHWANTRTRLHSGLDTENDLAQEVGAYLAGACGSDRGP